MINYKDFIQTFIDETESTSLLSSVSIFLFRKDGILLFHKLQKKQKFSSGSITSVGALMSGVWQASQALIKLLPGTKANDLEFRLAFDTSETGFYLLPINTKTFGEIYLGAVYLRELNPAQIKSKFRIFAAKLEEALSYDLSSDNDNSSLANDNLSTEEKLLFQNITDTEIDRLFEGARI